jgi:hypothetical protein
VLPRYVAQVLSESFGDGSICPFFIVVVWQQSTNFPVKRAVCAYRVEDTLTSFSQLKLSFSGTPFGRFPTSVIPSRFCSDFSYVVYLIISCPIYKRSNLHLGSRKYLINFHKCHPWAEIITQATIKSRHQQK